MEGVAVSVWFVWLVGWLVLQGLEWFDLSSLIPNLALGGCTRNLLQWFPILCRLKTKGWFLLPLPSTRLPFLCQEGAVSLGY